MLDFMEQRWDLTLGDAAFKSKLLHLDFLNQGNVAINTAEQAIENEQMELA